MRSPRHQLILLGLICQGCSWDNYFLPLINSLLWFVCLSASHRNIRISPWGEMSLLLGGCLLGYALELYSGRGVHFFIGHGLSLLQAVRLLRPLNRREQLFSILIALFHLGVAGTFVFDLRFIFIFIAAVILIPRTLMEFTGGLFASVKHEPVLNTSLGFNLAMGATMIICTVAFFVFCPRTFLGFSTPIRANTIASQGTMLDSIVDPVRNAVGQSAGVLMDIKGENLGYLRCFTLVNFDGQRWSTPSRPPLKRIPVISLRQLKTYQSRQVWVKNSQFLGQALPVDGSAVNLTGNFIEQALQNYHGGVVCETMVNMANNHYEFWIPRRPTIEPLYLAPQTQAYTRHPPPSELVRAWLDKVLHGVTDPLAQARKLEAYLRMNYTYQPGAPELNRIDPLEDFLLHQRQGHCERFASALTLLLRIKGIPSRLVIGYVPTSQNWFSGGYNIRFKDAHAWTEAYFPEVGWVCLDATPRAVSGNDWSVGDLFANIDLAWSTYVINFDAHRQYQLWLAARQSIVATASWIKCHGLVSAAMLLTSIFAWKWFVQRKQAPGAEKCLETHHRNNLLADHFYNRMLQLLARQGFIRSLYQTPLEFLGSIRLHMLAKGSEIELITHLYCAVRYGKQTISPSQQIEVEQALKRLKKWDEVERLN